MLGIDYGERRIGVALSDALGMTAQPLVVLEAGESALERLREIVVENDVELVVVGLPVSLSGAEGPSATAARALGDRIAKATGTTVEYWNEQFTTVEAERVLIEAGASRQKRRLVQDKVAAAAMLQGFLDARSRR